MNCIQNILSYGSAIIANALVHVGSLCSSKKEDDNELEAERNDDQAKRIIRSVAHPVRIPRMVLMSFGRRSFVTLAAAIARAGGFDNTGSLTYINRNGSGFGNSSDDDESNHGCFYMKGLSQNGVLTRRASAGGSNSLQGFYNGGGDQFGPHTL